MLVYIIIIILIHSYNEYLYEKNRIKHTDKKKNKITKYDGLFRKLNLMGKVFNSPILKNHSPPFLNGYELEYV